MIYTPIFNPTPEFIDVTISSLSANQAVMTDENKKLVSADYLNQAVKTTSTPTFTGLICTEDVQSLTTTHKSGTVEMEWNIGVSGSGLRRLDAAGTYLRIIPNNLTGTLENTGLLFAGRINGWPSFTAVEFLALSYLTGAGNEFYRIQSNASGGYTIRPIRIYTGGNTSQLVLATNGYVGIGVASPGWKLSVAGDIGSSGDVYAGGAMYATDFVTTSKVADLEGSSLDKLTLADWKDKDGRIVYENHYAHVLTKDGKHGLSMEKRVSEMEKMIWELNRKLTKD